jgi:uncharacterized coiled-coil protein SlyX
MPSRDEILAAYQAGPEATVALVEAVVTALQQEIADLSTQMEQLQARLNKDSHNSHKPPSSDPAPGGGGQVCLGRPSEITGLVRPVQCTPIA